MEKPDHQIIMDLIINTEQHVRNKQFEGNNDLMELFIKEAFEKIKEAIAEAPTLRSLNFDNEFILYTFSYDHSIVVVLTQKNEDEEEFLVSFMSIGLQGSELKYPTIDKQAFAVFKAVNHFHPYLLRSHTKIIVPHSVVRALLIQKEPRDR